MLEVEAVVGMLSGKEAAGEGRRGRSSLMTHAR